MNYIIPLWSPRNPRKSPRPSLGWTGFWLQAVLAALPIILLIYVLFFRPTASIQRRGFGVTEALGLVSLAILLFTISWCYRYTRLAKAIADPDKRPPKPAVTKTLWIGLLASCLGIILSLLLMAFEVGRLLLIFLSAPQGGVPVMQTATYDPSTWVPAIDMVGLLADISVVAAEPLVLTFTLWLLFRITTSTEYEHARDSTAK